MDLTTVFGYIIAALIGGVLALWGIWMVVRPRGSR